MKGAVDLITIIIVACMVVSIGLMLWFYLSVYYSQVSQTGEARTQRSLETLSSCMRIEEATQNKFFIRNCGTGLVTDNSLNVYIDDIRFSFSLDPASIDAGKTGTLTLQGVWGLPIGQHTLRLTNPNVETSASFEAKPPDSCVLDLEFDEGSGTTARDSSGNGNDGTLQNLTNGYVVWSNSGYFNNAVYFEGALSNGPMVSLPLVQSLNITQPFTITAWIKLKNIYSGHSQPILTRTGGNGNTGLFIDSGGHLLVTWGRYAGSGGDPIGLSSGNINLNIWQHVAARYDESGSMSLYINGLNVGSTNKNVTLYADELGKQFTVGYYWTGDYSFNGTIDSVRIYNQALTPDQTINFRLI